MASLEPKHSRHPSDIPSHVDVAIIGAGPTGLMAAEIAAKAGRQVAIFDRMRLPGRKFLLAGSDGLNLTYDEAIGPMAERYDCPCALRALLHQFGPLDLRAWADGLGAECFVGSSGRVFPRAMKASPLLRAWLHRLEGLGVRFFGNCRLTGWTPTALMFADTISVTANASVLALGGASWPRMGTDGGWTKLFNDDQLTALRPSNCRLPRLWSEKLLTKHDGGILKNIGVNGTLGDIRIVKQGLEGAPVYAASAAWQSPDSKGAVVDLMPHRSHEWLAERWGKMPPKLSTAAKLKRLNLKPVARALINEIRLTTPLVLPVAVKALPIPPQMPPSFDRAISTGGGVKWNQVDEDLRYQGRPNTFIGGEMLDWDAPTGGYLLQACFSMGHRIGSALAGE